MADPQQFGLVAAISLTDKSLQDILSMHPESFKPYNYYTTAKASLVLQDDAQPKHCKLIKKFGEQLYLMYTEDASKNYPGNLKGRKIKQKIVYHHANISNPEKCFVRLYNSRCPPNSPNNAYYLTPIKIPEAALATRNWSGQLQLPIYSKKGTHKNIRIYCYR